MPLPVIGNTMTNPMLAGNPNVAAVVGPLVAGPNISNTAKNGTALWAAGTLNITLPAGNFWYLPQAGANSVNWCLVPNAAPGQYYVISDQFGGCELHVLHNNHTNQYAVMHVFRGGGATAGYVRAVNWDVVHVKRSQQIAVIGGVAGTNWSVTFINTTVIPHVVETKFIRINVATMTVTHESTGDVAYAQPRIGFFRLIGRLFLSCFR